MSLLRAAGMPGVAGVRRHRRRVVIPVSAGLEAAFCLAQAETESRGLDGSSLSSMPP